MTKEIKDLDIDEKKLTIISEVYIESRYPGELGLLSDGIPTHEQAKLFIVHRRVVRRTQVREFTLISENT
jgi:hypothetical protein